MPTIEIDVPAGRPYESIERVVRERDVTYLEVLLHGADALATPSADRPADADSLDPADHTCDWLDCENPADVRVCVPEEADPLYYCEDCLDDAADYHDS